MELDISISPAAGTSPAAVLEHGEPSVRDPSLLSPAFAPAPSPGLVPSSGSGSGYQQIPPSPAVAVGNGSLSDHAHGTSSSSQSSLPSSSSPTAGTLPMVDYDLFGNPEAAAAAPLPTLLGGQWEQGELSSMAAPVLPECPSPGLFGFAGDFAGWPSEEMSSSFFSPSSAGGLAPPSSDNSVGFAQPSSSDSEMEPLPQSLCVPSLAVEDSPVDSPLPPIEEDEEMDVSGFLVPDPEDLLPNASWTATSPQMGGGGGASASWMAPESTSNNWPQMLAPAPASTCTMVSTASSGNLACHSGGSSIGVASSIGGMNMMKSSSRVLPLVPPSPQAAGSSSTNFNGFAQPSSSSVVAPHAPNLQGPLLPVKQEVMEMEYVDGTARRHPDFISLDDDEDGLYQDAIPCSIPGLNGWSSSSSGHSQGPSFAPEAASGYNVFGSISSSSPASFARAGSWLGSSNGSLSFGPFSWGGGSSSSRSPSFAPGTWCGGSRNSSPSFAPSSWGGGGSSSSPSFAPSSWGGSSSSSSSPSFATGSWGSSSSSTNFVGSTSIDNHGSSSMRNLSIGGKMPSASGLPPLPRAPSSSKKQGSAATIFTDPEMAIITSERKLQELVATDPKKVKRLLYNREYSKTAKVRKVMHTRNLEHTIVTLQEERKSLYAELQSLEEGSAALMAQKMEMEKLIGELEKQTRLKDAVREGLKAEIQNLKHLKLN